MLYCKAVTVPASTPLGEAVEEQLTVEEDVITRIQIRFPPGPCSLVKAAVFYGAERIFPHPAYDWAAGDDEIVEGFLYWLAPEKPCTLTLKAYNEDEAYNHTVLFRVEALPYEHVYQHELIVKAVAELRQTLEAIFKPRRPFILARMR